MKKLVQVLSIAVLCMFSGACQKSDQASPAVAVSPDLAIKKFQVMVIDSSRVAYTIQSPGNWVKVNGDFSVTYATFDGHQVSLCSTDGHLSLRVVSGNPFNGDPETLAFLTQEVRRLTTGESEQLGASGFSFRLTDGRPEWMPHMTSEKIGVVSHLYFASTTHVNGKLISASGV